MHYHRVYVPGGTYFFTIVTFQRCPIFTDPVAVETLRNAFQATMKQRPFSIIASVILPDHLHFLWALPPDDSDFSIRWHLIKSQFSRNYRLPAPTAISASRLKKGEKQIWQRRYWEHLIRDETDMAHHVEYIHYNPVKHGLAQTPGEWPYSSFSRFVREGLYPPDWGTAEKIWEGSEWME